MSRHPVAVVTIFLTVSTACAAGTERTSKPEPGRKTPSNTIVVNADCVLEMNGHRHLQRQLFGLTAYEGVNHLYTLEGAAFLRKWGVESLGLGGGFKWVLPSGAKNLDAAAIARWFANPDGAAKLFFHYPRTDRYVYGKALGNIRAAGAEPWKYLLGGVPGHATQHRVPTDYALWAQMAVEYLKLCRRADPELTYVHLLNEPNAHWYRDRKSGADYATFFKVAATTIKGVFGNLKIGGPVLCWPPTWPANQKGQAPWYTWDGYSKPLIDTAIDQLDFFDWHAYGVPARVLEGELHIVTGYAVAHHGKWLTNAITETNFRLTKEQWVDRAEHYRRRVVPMVRQTFSLMRHPDKIFCRQVHDLNAIAGDWFKFWGDGDVKVTPMQEFFAICKPLRGTRLVTSVAQALRADVCVEAAYRDDRLVVAVANFADRPRRIHLRLEGLAPDRIKETNGRVLDVESLREAASHGGSGEHTLSGQSLHVWVFRLTDALQPKRTRQRREYFGGTIMARLEPDRPTATVRIPLGGQGPESPDSAAIRFGIKGEGPAQGRWEVTLAGQRLTVDRPGAFVEVPLTVVPQGPTVKATLTRIDPPGRNEQPAFLSFASLVLTQCK